MIPSYLASPSFDPDPRYNGPIHLLNSPPNTGPSGEMLSVNTSYNLTNVLYDNLQGNGILYLIRNGPTHHLRTASIRPRASTTPSGPPFRLAHDVNASKSATHPYTDHTISFLPQSFFEHPIYSSSPALANFNPWLTRTQRISNHTY